MLYCCWKVYRIFNKNNKIAGNKIDGKKIANIPHTRQKDSS